MSVPPRKREKKKIKGSTVEESKLLELALKGKPEKINKLVVKKGTDVNCRDPNDHETALHIAVEAGNLDAARELINLGADKNAQVKFISPALIRQMMNGQTPLHVAVLAQTKDCIKLLTDRGANSSILDKNDNTPISLAISLHNDEIFKEVIVNANFKFVNSKGNTFLHEAAIYGNHKAMAALLAQGSEIDAQNETGNTALHLAALSGKTGVIAALMAYKPDVKIQNRSGLTPSACAFQCGFSHLSVLLSKEYVPSSSSATFTAASKSFYHDRSEVPAAPFVQRHSAAPHQYSLSSQTLVPSKRTSEMVKSPSIPEKIAEDHSFLPRSISIPSDMESQEHSAQTFHAPPISPRPLEGIPPPPIPARPQDPIGTMPPPIPVRPQEPMDSPPMPTRPASVGGKASLIASSTSFKMPQTKQAQVKKLLMNTDTVQLPNGPVMPPRPASSPISPRSNSESTITNQGPTTSPLSPRSNLSRSTFTSPTTSPLASRPKSKTMLVNPTKPTLFSAPPPVPRDDPGPIRNTLSSIPPPVPREDSSPIKNMVSSVPPPVPREDPSPIRNTLSSIPPPVPREDPSPIRSMVSSIPPPVPREDPSPIRNTLSSIPPPVPRDNPGPIRNMVSSIPPPVPRDHDPSALPGRNSMPPLPARDGVPALPGRVNSGPPLPGRDNAIPPLPERDTNVQFSEVPPPLPNRYGFLPPPMEYGDYLPPPPVDDYYYPP